MRDETPPVEDATDAIAVAERHVFVTVSTLVGVATFITLLFAFVWLPVPEFVYNTFVLSLVFGFVYVRGMIWLVMKCSNWAATKAVERRRKTFSQES